MQTKWRWYFAHFYLSISLSLAAQAQRSGSPPSPIVDANNRFAFKLSRNSPAKRLTTILSSRRLVCLLRSDC